MRTLHFLDGTGDTQFDLDTQIDLATEFFNTKLAAGAMAYEVTPTGNNLIHSITEDMTKIVFHDQFAGG